MEGARHHVEDAFAEDTTGPFGSFVWPPRSYFCNFCGREFGSAQALGGHMNVHRRDRARLKQSPGFENDSHHHHQSPRKIVRSEHPCTLMYSSNYSNSTRAFVPPVSAALTEEINNCQKHENAILSDERKTKKQNVGRKRWRSDEVSLPLLAKSQSTSMKADHLQEVKRLCLGATQDLDLELRLGFSLS